MQRRASCSKPPLKAGGIPRIPPSKSFRLHSRFIAICRDRRQGRAIKVLQSTEAIADARTRIVRADLTVVVSDRARAVVDGHVSAVAARHRAFAERARGAGATRPSPVICSASPSARSSMGRPRIVSAGGRCCSWRSCSTVPQRVTAPSRNRSTRSSRRASCRRSAAPVSSCWRAPSCATSIPARAPGANCR